MTFQTKKGALIVCIILAVIAVLISLLLIVVVNQYRRASYNYDTTDKLELTYSGFDTKNYSKGGIEYIIKTEELQKPIYFGTLTNSYCDLNTMLLGNNTGEKFTAYIIKTSKEEYSYEIVEMQFYNGDTVLTMDSYNKGHGQNAIIGFILVPTMLLICLTISGMSLYAFIKKKYMFPYS